MCPIETPEGPNIGLIGSLASMATVSEFGFIQTPYRKVDGGKVTDEIVYLDAAEEAQYTIAQASRVGRREDGQVPATSRCSAARRRARPSRPTPKDVEYMDVAPAQIVSVATALIPFLEHNDANRALMGANMQRQAVPLMITAGAARRHRPRVPRRGRHGRRRAVAQRAGTVVDVDAEQIVGRDEGRQGRLPADEVHALEPGHADPPEADRRARRQGQGRAGARRRQLDRRRASSRSARTCSSRSCRSRATTSRTRSSSRSGS